MTREDRVKIVATEKKNMVEFVSWAEHNKCVVFISYPRSGREWVYRLVEKVTEKPTMRIFDTKEAPYEDYAYFYWHGYHYKNFFTKKAFENIDFVHLIRDPRDCMISDAIRRVTTGAQQKMSTAIVQDAIELLLSPDMGYEVRYSSYPGRIIQYERMCLSPVAELQRLLDLLNVEITYPVDFAVRDCDRSKTTETNSDDEVVINIAHHHHKTGLERYQCSCLKWKKRNPYITSTDLQKIWESLGPTMEMMGYTEEGHALAKLELGLSTAGVWAIGKLLFETILYLIPHGSEFLELGSGSGTAELAKYFKMTSIEHYSGWVDLYDSTYIHAPLVDNWYDPNAIMEGLRNKPGGTFRYSGILIDGPNGSERRSLFPNFMNKFDLSQWVFFDDIQRDLEYKAYRTMTGVLHRTHAEFIDDNGKAFGIVAPLTQEDELKQVASKLSLTPYKPMEH